MRRSALIVAGLFIDALVIFAMLASPSPAVARMALTITPTARNSATHAGERFVYIVHVESTSLIPDAVRIDMDIPQSVGHTEASNGRCATLAFRTSCLMQLSAMSPGVVILVASGRLCPTSQWAHFHIKDGRGNKDVRSVELKSLDCR